MPDANKEFHRVPRMSASGFARLAQCHASFAAEQEMADFRSVHGVADDPDSESAASGTDMHAILAEVPFSSERFNFGGDYRRPSEKIDSACEALGADMADDDLRLASMLISRRDGLINGWLESSVEQYGGFDNFAIQLDDARLPLPGTEFTGLPDVLAVHDAPDGGGKHVLINDYKTGWKGASYPHPSVNGQLLALAVLADANLPDVASVTVSLQHRGNVSSKVPIEAARFGREELDAARVYVDSVLMKSAKLAEFAEKYFKGGKEIPKKQADKIAAYQSVGDHCKYCNGKACCQSFTAAAAQKASDLTRKTPLTEKDHTPMTPQQLKTHIAALAALEDSAKPFAKAMKEVESVARALATSDPEVFEGDVTLKPGARSLSPGDVTLAKLFSTFKQAGFVPSDATFEGFVESVKAKPSVSAITDIIKSAVTDGSKKKVDVAELSEAANARIKLAGGHGTFEVSQKSPSVVLDGGFVERVMADMSGSARQDAEEEVAGPTAS